MIDSLPIYKELYAVSDIHMGGSPGFQILRHGPRLGKFIHSLEKIRPDEDVALVLNGDIIDSLAENIDGYIATYEAEQMMERIYKSETFQPIWDALAGFVQKPKRHLVIVIGNHDIELALPNVRNSIRKRLGSDDPAAQGRILFETRGAGHACMVGNARVFCTHGNEGDTWNAVDHGALSRLAAQINAAQTINLDAWEPNAGTKFVIDVMNTIKEKYPFVDLLKPETETVVPILLVIDPGLIREIPKVLPIFANTLLGGFKEQNILSAEADDITMANDHAAASELAINMLLGPHLKEGLHKSAPEDVDSLLLSIEENMAEGRRAEEMVDDAVPETLGWPGYIIDRLRGLSKAEALRRAIHDWLGDDHTFELTKKDRTFRRVTGRVGPQVDFVITGHSHLERAIQNDSASQYYYNCGTWIRLIRLTESVLGDESAFGKVFDAITAGKMTALDAAEIPSPGGGGQPLIMSRSTVVKISAQSDGVVGQLYHVEDKGSDNIKMITVPNTKFRK